MFAYILVLLVVLYCEPIPANTKVRLLLLSTDLPSKIPLAELFKCSTRTPGVMLKRLLMLNKCSAKAAVLIVLKLKSRDKVSDSTAVL